MVPRPTALIGLKKLWDMTASGLAHRSVHEKLISSKVSLSAKSFLQLATTPRSFLSVEFGPRPTCPVILITENWFVTGNPWLMLNISAVPEVPILAVLPEAALLRAAGVLGLGAIPEGRGLQHILKVFWSMPDKDVLLSQVLSRYRLRWVLSAEFNARGMGPDRVVAGTGMTPSLISEEIVNAINRLFLWEGFSGEGASPTESGRPVDDSTWVPSLESMPHVWGAGGAAAPSGVRWGEAVLRRVGLPPYSAPLGIPWPDLAAPTTEGDDPDEDE